MFRHIVEARKILREHHFDKLMYKKDKGTPPTFAQLVEKYNLVNLLSIIPLTLDQVLLGKITALKRYIKTIQGQYDNRTLFHTLHTTCEVLEDKYRQSLQGTHKTLLFSLYDTRPEDVKHNTEHKCPYRWYQFKELVQPCINNAKATATLAELNALYKKQLTLEISDDCTNNAYELLDYIRFLPLPQILKPVQQCSSIYDLIRVITNFELRSAVRKSVGATSEDEVKKADARRLVVQTFNSLCPEDAYIFSKRVQLYIRQDSASGEYFKDVPQSNKRPVDWSHYWDPLISKRNGAVLSATDMNGKRIQLDMDAFNKKVQDHTRSTQSRGGARRTRRLRS